MHKKVLVLFILVQLTALLSSVSSAELKREITVSAAMSLKTAFEEMGKMYEVRNKGIKIRFNFGASGDLMRQIEGGAPVDVFASAAPNEMDALEKKGLIAPGTRNDFAKNAMVLLAPSHVKVRVHSFTDLTSGDVKKIAVGNFRTVPAGRYAEEILRYYRILPSIKGKLIFAENVRQVLDYVARNEVDAGIVYATDAKTREREVTVKAVADEKSHGTVVYPIAMITNSKNPKPAEAFIGFVRSAEGQKILKKYGFMAVGEYS